MVSLDLLVDRNIISINQLQQVGEKLLFFGKLQANASEYAIFRLFLTHPSSQWYQTASIHVRIMSAVIKMENPAVCYSLGRRQQQKMDRCRWWRRYRWQRKAGGSGNSNSRRAWR
jgi:hypothetical protein